MASSAPGLATVLMLGSAQAIAASRVGPLVVPAERDVTFAALLGWWYGAESREFVEDDRALRRCALALDATAEKVRGGQALTVALLREEVDVGDDDGATGSDASGAEAPGLDLIEATLHRAARASWPCLLLAAELGAGECAQVPGVSAAIARAAAPLLGGLNADVFVVAPGADDVTAALRALAEGAHAARWRVDAYRVNGAAAAERARGFGRGARTALALLDLLAGTPAITVVGAAHALELTVPTLGAAVERLLEAGLLREITGRGRDRVYVYVPAVALAG